MRMPVLKVDVSSGDCAKVKAEALVVGVFQGGKPQEGLAALGKEAEKAVLQALKKKWLSGRPGGNLTVAVTPEMGLKVERLLLMGLGPVEKVNEESLRAFGARIGKAVPRGRVLCLLSRGKAGEIKRREVIRALAEGALLGSYVFDQYQSKEKDKEEEKGLERLTLLVRKDDLKGAKADAAQAGHVAAGVFLARDLGNHPGNVVDPEYLAETARQLGKAYPIKVSVLNEKGLKKKGMGGIMAVGQGSAKPPRLITLEYNNGKKGTAPFAVVGKGVTFDTGGISLKPGAKMDEMKFDMSGAAAVLGLMRAVAESKLPVNLVGVIGAAENMPSSTAQRPGDILKTARGVTVEVLNTDAEGRLVLADALHHAESFNPTGIVDLATLTGACVIALGGHATGLMGRGEGLLLGLTAAGEESGERVWRLPLFDEYQEQIKSPVADIKNVGGREAGTITAACFLSRFVEKDRPWAHLDIAGTAWDMSGKRPHIPKGGVGVGVRLLHRYIATRLV